MPSPFDGMNGIIAATLGDLVTIFPGGGGARNVQGIFRETPLETGDTFGEGGFWTSAPSLKLMAHDAAGLLAGDRVQADGRDWRVLSNTPSGSPAADRFRLIELEAAPDI